MAPGPQVNPYRQANAYATDAATGDAPVHAVIVAGMLMNPALALANNFLFTLNPQIVMAAQLAVTLAAIATIAARRPQVGWTFAAAGGLFLCCVLTKFVATGSLDPRFVYDASLPPLFLVLGAAARRFSPRFLGALLLLLLAGAVFELAAPDLYAGLLNPRKYFYYTRDWVAAVTAPDASILSSSDLYLGSERYTGGFFFFTHRAGSLFLEPLSLGYFAAIAAILFVHAGIDRGRTALAIVGCLALAVMSDTRIAVFVILTVALLRPLLSRIPRLPLYASPYLMALIAVALYFAAQGAPGDLGLRLGVTAEPLLNAGPFAVLFGGIDAAHAADSGIVYVIANAGLIGWCVYPLLASGVLLDERPSPVSVAMLLYLFAGLSFGYAPMSIKTAAILGYGVATLGRTVRVGAPETGNEPFPTNLRRPA